MQEEFRQDPLTGHLFLFVNKRRDRMKAIFWDDDGFVIWYKRLEAGDVATSHVSTAATTLELEAHELAMILRGIDLKSARRRTRYAATDRCLNHSDSTVTTTPNNVPNGSLFIIEEWPVLRCGGHENRILKNLSE